MTNSAVLEMQITSLQAEIAALFAGPVASSNQLIDLGDVTITESDSGWSFSGFWVDELRVAWGSQNVSIYGGAPEEFYNYGFNTYANLASVNELGLYGYRGEFSIGAVYDESFINGSYDYVSIGVAYGETNIGGWYETVRLGWSYDDINLFGTGTRLFSGGNDDYVDATDATDVTVFGGEGNDEIEGGDGNDALYGEDGNDYLGGGEGNDSLSGGEGNDDLYGDDGNDLIEGGAGRDYLRGGDGDDTMLGDEGDDYLRGDDGDDVMGGGAGNDYLSGGAGNDMLVDGSGEDYLFGDAGSDTFVFVADGDNDVGDLGWRDDEVDLVLVDGVGAGSGDLTLYGVGVEDQVVGFTAGGVEFNLGDAVLAAGGELTLGGDTYTFDFI